MTDQTENLPAPVAKRGIAEAAWRTLMNNLYPGADPHSVLMVWDYCLARKLDPLKKPCHIVPMQVKDARTGEYGWRDVVMPGIYEYRTTANRTGEYMGHSKPEYGPPVEFLGVTVPEWCALTVYRWNEKAGIKCEYPVQVFFNEVAATRRDKKSGATCLNGRWTQAPIQMLTKCAEAAALREAFPDELGGSSTAEESEGRQATELLVVSPHSGTEEKANVDPDLVQSLRNQMLDIMDADLDEDAIGLNAFDFEVEKLTAIPFREATIEAVWATFPAKTRNAWKKFVEIGRKIADQPAFRGAA